MTDWYKLKIDEVASKLDTNIEKGLSPGEAESRLGKYGKNELIDKGMKKPWLILWEQFTEVMVIILIIASVISLAFGEYKDAIAILVIVLINAYLGFTQEYKAEKEMAALKKLSTPTVKVRRGGHVLQISSLELVPGDVLLLEAGNTVPADARLVESANLRAQEATLTGESEPVDKDAKDLHESSKGIGDRSNMVFMGTNITYGRSTAIITGTGMDTELGHIASLIQRVDSEPTPLQKRLAQLGKGLAFAAIIIVAIIFVIGITRGESIEHMFITAVSLAVSAVPEGLPAVVTIALALGARRMLKRRALIRKLPAVETLGSVTVICSDKTGTLTKNEMTVTILDVAGERIDLIHALDGTAPFDESESHGTSDLLGNPSLALMVAGGALCNDAIIETGESPGNQYRTIGDPTEIALLIAAAKSGIMKSDLELVFPRISEFPFDSDRKSMSTLHRCPVDNAEIPDVLKEAWKITSSIGTPEKISFTKGAIKRLLSISTRVWINDHIEDINDEYRERILAVHDELAEKGMRVLGVGFQPNAAPPEKGKEEELERNLVFVGLVAMMDPARPEVKEAVQTCVTAGIRPMMITGDHPLTAQHIASELGIGNNDRYLTGEDLDRMTSQELDKAVAEVDVYARVSPEHKLNLIQALQKRGEIVAMTGDGVNDAPALKTATIGVSMGITGTDVAKEAADIVLQDDNFATIVAAVEEGRTIYDNIRKFIKYLLNSNSGEIWVMMIAPFLKMPLPLLPIQILWLNLVTDGFPALALGVEPPEKGTMRRDPYPPSEGFFKRGLGVDIVWTGLLMGILSLGIGFYYWLNDPNGLWQTMVFSTITFSSMFIALAIRSEKESFFSMRLFSNKFLIVSVAFTMLLQFIVIYWEPAQSIFSTKSLMLKDLLLSIGLSTIVFWAIEFKKLILRIRSRR